MRNAPVILTNKQLRWIDEYLIDFNGAAAAVRAGYSEKSARSIAHENATKPDIQAVLRERQAAMAKELQITRTGVIKGLLEAAEIGRKQRNPGAMVSAFSTMAKMLGYYSPEIKRVELTAGQGAVQADFAMMTDGQLLALMGKDAATSVTVL